MFEEGLAELHTHLGGSVSSDILWSLAHEQGIALPVKDYWEFDRLVTVSDPRGVPNLDALDQIYHWTELIQSSPLAVERSVHAAIGGAYRSQGITTLELRFNPMKRNRGGERDLDHIILAAIRGSIARRSSTRRCARADPDDGPHVRRAAERGHRREGDPVGRRGIVGVDIAGPRPGGERYEYAQVAPMVETAREAGLGVTIHVGEEGGAIGREEIAEVVDVLRPERIGHGILAAGDDGLMTELREREIVLEICPTSNLLTKALPDEDAVRETFRAFVENGVLFTIATDGPGNDAHTFARRVRPAAADRARSTPPRRRRRTGADTTRRSRPHRACASRRNAENTPFGQWFALGAAGSLGAWPMRSRTVRLISPNVSGRSSTSSLQAARTTRWASVSGSPLGPRRRTATSCGRSSA